MDSSIFTMLGSAAAMTSVVASIINLINSKAEFHKMKEHIKRKEAR
jgi:hypothetical protein